MPFMMKRDEGSAVQTGEHEPMVELEPLCTPKGQDVITLDLKARVLSQNDFHRKQLTRLECVL